MKGREVVLGWIAASLFAAPARAAVPGLDTWVNEISSNAVGLQGAGQYDAAVGAIDAGLGRCPQAKPPAKCRAVLNYTRGYVAQRESMAPRKDPGDQQARARVLRQAAVEAYRSVLEDEPGHRPSIDALVRLYGVEGSTADAVAVLMDGAQRSPANASYAIQLGDVHLAAGKPREAIAAYERAAAAAPVTGALLEKIVQAYEALLRKEGPTDSAEQPPLLELFEKGRDWRQHHPGAARRAFEAVMARWREQPVLAQRALVEWVDQMGRTRALTPFAVDGLPFDDSFAPFSDLRAYVSRPWVRPASDNWWLGGGFPSDRMDALARASLALGSAMLLENRPEDAERCWQTSAGLFGEPSVAKVEVQTELAGLYARHPELDLSAVKADQLIQELFLEKGRAYRRGDLASIQQYHTVLGVFLFEREIYGTKTNPRSAIFQLDHALDMAERREKGGTPHQPLAELRKRLAESYEKAKMRDLAGPKYLMAVQAFLDEDQLEQARDAVARLDALGAGGTNVPTPLRSLLDLREQLRGSSSVEGADVRAERLFREPWSPQLSSAFRERQEFKVLADLATRSGSVALASKALARTRKAPLVLVGTSDYVRLEGVERLVATRYQIEEVIVRSAWPSKSDTASRKLYAASTPNPEFIYLAPDTLLGARLTEHAGVPPEGTSMSLDDGRLVIDAPGPGTDAQALRKFMTAATTVPGVREVALKER